MWRDISDEVELRAALLLGGSKIIHDSQVVGEVQSGCISVCVPRYRVRLESAGDTNKFFIERDFDAKELQEIAFSEHVENRKPLLVVHGMKFLDVTHKDRELFINADSICVIERLMANRCKVTLETGLVIELEYDAKRIRQKLEELEPASFAGA